MVYLKLKSWTPETPENLVTSHNLRQYRCQNIKYDKKLNKIGGKQSMNSRLNSFKNQQQIWYRNTNYNNYFIFDNSATNAWPWCVLEVEQADDRWTRSRPRVDTMNTSSPAISTSTRTCSKTEVSWTGSWTQVASSQRYYMDKRADCRDARPIYLSTARQKWRLDGPALSGHLLYSLVNHAYANRYHHHLVG